MARRPFTAKDLATLDRLSDPRLSPDGRYVVYCLQVINFDAGKNRHELWLLDLKARVPSPRRLAISKDGATHARFAPDGKRIYFLSSRNKNIAQIFHTDLKGGKAKAATRSPVNVETFRLAPDGSHLVFSARVYPDCRSLEETGKRLDKLAAEKYKAVLYKRLFVRHWDEWMDGRVKHLFALALDKKGNPAGKSTALVHGFDGNIPPNPFGDETAFTIAPNGKSAVFTARVSGDNEPWNTVFNLWCVPLNGKIPPENFTPNSLGTIASPVFSPDGNKLAYLSMKRAGFEADKYWIMLRDMKTGNTREVASDWDRSPEQIVFTPDGKKLIAVAFDTGNRRLFSIDVMTGKVFPLTQEGHVGGFAMAENAIVYGHDSLTSPPALFIMTLDGKNITQLTAHNKKALAQIHFSPFEQFSFPGWNNETVCGYVIKPADFKVGRKYPVAFLIHGGPQSSFGNAFGYRWNPQVWAGAGYAVVMIDFHGSVGYDQAFTDAVSGHWGDRPLEDLQKGWAYALKKFSFLDAARAAAAGASFGGYMVNWMAGTWNKPWKCFVNHDGVFDLRSMYYSTEELWMQEWDFGGPAYDAPEKHEEFNPVRYVTKWTKPMLVIHGGKDFRVPLEQGIATFTALQRRGIPSQFLHLPEENHWVLKPQNLVQWFDAMLNWMNDWTRPSH